jgi:hypothetical protein
MSSFSRCSGRTDRIAKVREYAAVPSIKRYVILESTSVGLTVMERSRPEDAWRVTAQGCSTLIRFSCMPGCDQD